MACETSPLGRSYSVPSSVRKGGANISLRKSSADPTTTGTSALGLATSLERVNQSPDSTEATDGFSSGLKRTSVNFFSRIMASDDTSAAEQAEQEIYRTMNQIRRDLNDMSSKDQYLSKWLGTLQRKIHDLESVVFTHGPPPGAQATPPVRQQEQRPSPSASPVDEPYDEVCVQSSHRIQSVDSVDSYDGYDGGLESLNSSGRDLPTISERRSERGSYGSGTSPPPWLCPASPGTSDGNVHLRRGSSEALAALEKKRPDSTCSGIHADELFELYRLSEKSVRAEMGLPHNSQSSSKAKNPKSIDSDIDKEKTDSIDGSLGRKEVPAFRSYSPSPLVRGEDISKPVLIYTDYEDSTSDPSDAESSMRYAQRNNALFGSVRMRSGSIRVNHDITPSGSGKNTPTGRLHLVA